MPIHPQFLVRGADGRPLPSPELIARLQQYDPRVGLFYTSAAWAITEAWADNDPRRSRIQAGEMQPEFAFDICGYLPVTCAVDEAPAYIERELRNYTPEQFQAVRHAVTHWNDARPDIEDKVMAGIEESMSATGPSIGVFNVPSGPGTGEIAEASPPAGAADAADPSIANAMAKRRRRKTP